MVLIGLFYRAVPNWNVFSCVVHWTWRTLVGFSIDWSVLNLVHCNEDFRLEPSLSRWFFLMNYFNFGCRRQAGLFDYASMSFAPAVRVDLHHHVLDRLRLVDNDHDGLGVVYSDLYYPERIPNVKNSDFSANGRHGISVRSLGLQLSDCRVQDNRHSGLHYNPMVTRQELREMAGWLAILKVGLNFNCVVDRVGIVH